MLEEIDVSIPPTIRALDPNLAQPTLKLTEQATAAIAALEATERAQDLAALSGFLLRTESVASSKIERIYADSTDTARAFAGLESGRDAQLTAAAAQAVSGLITAPWPLTMDAIARAHHELLSDDPLEGDDAGKVRAVQNWIGGSDFTPRGAIYVPPPPALVNELLDDLLRFTNRSDMVTITQAAIVHAQFESIHPFTDGNGRIGRALLNTILRHRGLTNQVVIPVASVMLAGVEAYFAQLDAYREGDIDSLVGYIATGVVTACEEALLSSEALAALPGLWRDASSPRKNSAADRLIDELASHPLVTSSTAASLIGSSSSAIFTALARLEKSGVLVEITGRGREKVWLAQDVVDELDRLTDRIGRREAPPTVGHGAR